MRTMLQRDCLKSGVGRNELICSRPENNGRVGGHALWVPSLHHLQGAFFSPIRERVEAAEV